MNKFKYMNIYIKQQRKALNLRERVEKYMRD